MTYSSAPIESKSYVLSNKSAEEVIPLGAKGATSYSYLVRIEGKEHFMKQLRPELKDDWRYRSAYQKEYEVGRSIASEYIVKYEAIDENAEDCISSWSMSMDIRSMRSWPRSPNTFLMGATMRSSSYNCSVV